MPMIRDYYQPQLPTLLFSLHPQAARAIRSGHKVLEYRRRFFTAPFQAFIYVTGPNGGVQLYVRCGAAIQQSPATLGRLGHAVQGDDPAEVHAYFHDQTSGLAIPILAVTDFPPLSLVEMRRQFPNFVAPRSYVFLDRPARLAQLRSLLTQHGAPLRFNEQVLNKITRQLKKELEQ